MRVAVIAMMAMVAAAETTGDPPPSPDTLGILATIDASRAQLTPADRAAARHLQAAGDRAYKARRYSTAFTAYANAYPNAPLPEAYILAGDAHWRAVLQQHDKAVPTSSACEPEGPRLARALAQDLAQHHAVGLALAARDRRGPLTDRLMVFYKRAGESAACMGLLATPAPAPTACFDFEALRRCLGDPLIP